MYVWPRKQFNTSFIVTYYPCRSTDHWKNLLIDLVKSLPILTDWKEDSYDLIFVIIDWLTKIVHYKPVKVSIDAPGHTEVNIDVVVRHDSHSDSTVID